MHMFRLVKEKKKTNKQANCDIISPLFAGISVRGLLVIPCHRKL